MMAQPKPHLSITLPRSFEFHYIDGQVPQTPAPQHQVELTDTIEPPPPPKQTFKIRRRRTDNTHETGAAVPTIEMSEAVQDTYTGTGLGAPFSTPGYLAPRPSYLRLLSPPRTPASQVTTYSNDSSESSEWSMIHDVRGNLIERPASACSDFSNSSASSFGSSNAPRSLGDGSCTSPESDGADPFSYYELKPGPSLASPLPSDLPTAKRVKTTRHPKWTPEMDNHLWITYMVYVQDPRVTPFKMLPGTAPPLGVCHRVAREAKRTWKGHRTAQGDRLVPRISIQRAESPDTVRPAGSDGNTPTPTPADHRSNPVSRWPRSEAATRRRLRDLCKRKPSLSAHYMRLLKTRSPSPFESSSSSPRQQPAPTPDTSAFASRDMSVSLVAATAPSMQADGPLAQLTRDPPATTPVPAPAVQRPTDWFARIGRSQARAQAHQKSQSLQLGLGLNSWSHSNNKFERGSILASPFDSDLGRDAFMQNLSNTQSLGRGQINRRSVNDSALNSPLDLDGPMPTVRSLKRRFGVDEDNTPQPSLQNLFAAPPTPASNSCNRPLRNRGFSLGDMGVSTPNLASFFTQPTPSDDIMEEAPEARPSTSGSGFLTAPRSLQPPRLGSPFSGSSSNTRFNTFPRRMNEPESESPMLPFEEKLRQLSAKAANHNRDATD